MYIHTGQQQAGVVAHPPAVPPRPQPSQVFCNIFITNHQLLHSSWLTYLLGVSFYSRIILKFQNYQIFVLTEHLIHGRCLILKENSNNNFSYFFKDAASEPNDSVLTKESLVGRTWLGDRRWRWPSVSWRCVTASVKEVSDDLCIPARLKLFWYAQNYYVPG